MPDSRAQEVNIDRDEAGFCKPLTIQLGDLLSRYLHEITPQKKSRDSEARRISRLLKIDYVLPNSKAGSLSG